MIKNYTPHDLIIDCQDGFNPIILKSDGIARVTTTRTITDNIVIGNVNIPVYETHYSEVIGLPEENDNDIYIVSLIVKIALPERKDLYTPGELIRDEKGNVIACKGLSK